METTRRLRVVISGKFPSLNDFFAATKKHRLAGAAMKAEFTNKAFDCFRNKSSYNCPVYISFTWFEESRRRDPDNVVFAKKFILDGMVKAGIIPDDNYKWVVGFEDVVLYGEATPRVEIEVIPVKEKASAESDD